MKIEEATKKATPGRIPGDTQGTVDPIIAEALRDHWQEHGPKLLKIAKALREMCASEFPEDQWDEYYDTIPEADKVIAAAEKVRGI